MLTLEGLWTLALPSMCGLGSALLVLGFAAGPTIGCSSILGIGDLPAPSDAGTAASSSDGSGSGSGGSSGAGSTSSGSGGSSGAGSGGGSSEGGSGGSSGGGSSSGGTANDGGNSAVAAFLGTWQLTGGTETLSMCTTGADQTDVEPTTIMLTFAPGATSDLVGTYGGQGSTGCSFLANVSGAVLTAPAGQTCTEFSSGDTDVLTLMTYTFTRSGNTAGESATGVIVDQTNPAMCDLSETATYTKI
jgi:hypothetical protein